MPTTTTATATTPITHVYKQRDKYGRSTTVAERRLTRVAILITLPKAYAENYGHRYLINDRTEGDVAGEVTYHATRREAVAELVRRYWLHSLRDSVSCVCGYRSPAQSYGGARKDLTRHIERARRTGK